MIESFIVIMHRMFLLKEYPSYLNSTIPLIFFFFLEKILARFVTICVILYALHGDYKIIGFFKYHTSHVAKNKKK